MCACVRVQMHALGVDEGPPEATVAAANVLAGRGVFLAAVRVERRLFQLRHTRLQVRQPVGVRGVGGQVDELERVVGQVEQAAGAAVA